MVESFPSMSEVLGSSPSTEKTKTHGDARGGDGGGGGRRSLYSKFL